MTYNVWDVKSYSLTHSLDMCQWSTEISLPSASRTEQLRRADAVQTVRTGFTDAGNCNHWTVLSQQTSKGFTSRQQSPRWQFNWQCTAGGGVIASAPGLQTWGRGLTSILSTAVISCVVLRVGGVVNIRTR